MFNATTAWLRNVGYNYSNAGRSGTGKVDVFSVRLIRD
jgi:hypothetical protein